MSFGRIGRPWSRGSRRTRLLGTLITVLAVTGSAAQADETIKLDCGVNALFVLLELEKRLVSIDQLQAALPAPHPEGHSMAELSAASGSLGLLLVCCLKAYGWRNGEFRCRSPRSRTSRREGSGISLSSARSV
jgi:hypothetical protein